MSKKKDRKNRKDRRTELAKSILLAWDSLKSHLQFAVKCPEKDANEEWHARCVRDYSIILHASATELYELAKIDFPEIATAHEPRLLG